MTATVVIARLRPRAGSEAALEAVLADLVPAVHEEAGCTLYAAHRDTATGDIVFVERYEDADAYLAHMSGSALAAHGHRLADHLAAEVEVTVLEPVWEGFGSKATL
jgi:quinol monooxygenase YgiN